MRRNFLFASFLLGLLLLASPAFAINYSASAFLDLTSLSFSGINFTLTEGPPGNVPYAQRGAVSVSPPCCFAFDDPKSEFWLDVHTGTEIPTVGTANAVFSSTQLASSINLIGPGDAFSNTLRQGTIFAQEAGYLTASIRYSFAQSGVPSSLTGFSAGSHVGLNLGLSNLLVSPDLANGTQTGTLSTSWFFNANESALFALSTGTSASAVPEPNMLWPTLAGMVGITLVVGVRRRQGMRMPFATLFQSVSR